LNRQNNYVGRSNVLWW